MEKFTTHTGVARPAEAVATSTPTRSSPPSSSSASPRPGFEDALFASWRQDPEFVLNQPAVRGRHPCSSPVPTSAPARAASTRSGRCATSASRSCSARVRRHLPRQLRQAGPARRRRLRGRISSDLGGDRGRARASRLPSTSRRETVTLSGDSPYPFEIDDYTRWRLLEGLDDIGLTLRDEDAIAQFEARREAWRPDDPSRSGS